MQTKDVKAVFSKHRGRLIKIFRKHAGDSLTITKEQCEGLAREMNFIDEALTEGEISQIIHSVQRDEDSGNKDISTRGEVDHNANMAEELGYFDFLEFLAVIAMHKTADPFAVLSAKVASFLDGMVAYE